MDGMQDGSTETAQVVVVATKNRPNSIDLALRRRGRFDRQIGVGKSFTGTHLPLIDADIILSVPRCSRISKHIQELMTIP